MENLRVVATADFDLSIIKNPYTFKLRGNIGNEFFEIPINETIKNEILQYLNDIE